MYQESRAFEIICQNVCLYFFKLSYLFPFNFFLGCSEVSKEQTLVCIVALNNR